jgi:hypothetical protein
MKRVTVARLPGPAVGSGLKTEQEPSVGRRPSAV